MTGSRDTVLARIRSALGADPSPPHTPPRTYRTGGDHLPGSPHVIDLLIDRLTDYKAHVHHTDQQGLAAAVADALGEAASVVVPSGLPEDLVQACHSDGRRVVVDSEPAYLSSEQLDGIDGVVTGAAVAIASTGTIILDGHADQGRRAITLIPDRHVVVLRQEQIVESVPEALAVLDPVRPLTMIAGPSATSDIELERVEGVHGPRLLHVIVVETTAPQRTNQ